jgi:hypothetical protein
MHTLLDARGTVPAFTWITEARSATALSWIPSSRSADQFYLFDRAFVDFPRRYRLTDVHAFFVSGAKIGLK